MAKSVFQMHKKVPNSHHSEVFEFEADFSIDFEVFEEFWLGVVAVFEECYFFKNGVEAVSKLGIIFI